MKKTFIYSLVLAAFLVGCGDSAKEAASTVTEKAKESTSHAVEATKEAAKSAAAGAVEAVKEGKDMATAAKDAVKETASKAVEATKEAASNAVEATKETASKAVEATKEAASSAVESAKEAGSAAVAAATGGADGAAIYKKCAACHGAKAEKKALGASKVIGGWDAAKVEEALHGYKNGTYGGNMKGVMKGQVASMSDADIKAVSEYISTLK
jgi:cytochrome c553